MPFVIIKHGIGPLVGLLASEEQTAGGIQTEKYRQNVKSLLVEGKRIREGEGDEKR